MGTGQASGQDEHAAIDEIGRTVIAAAREEFVRFGIRRANVEEIARRAGVARVTVYRRFESKTALLQAVVLADVADFAARVDAALGGEGPIADRIADATLLSVVELRRHPLLNTVVRSDPETLLSALTFEGETQFGLIKALLTARVSELMSAGDIPQGEASRVAEAVLRLIFTTVLLPFGELPGSTDEDIRRFAREFIVPLVVPPPA